MAQCNLFLALSFSFDLIELLVLIIMRPFAFYLHFIIFPLLLEVTAPNVHTVNRVEFTTVDIFSQISLLTV